MGGILGSRLMQVGLNWVITAAGLWEKQGSSKPI